MTKKVKTTTEEIIDEPKDEMTDKDRKSERFFNFFKNEENFVISLYKVGERGKAGLIDKFENCVPDLLKIRDLWGGGTYKLYAHAFDGDLMDSTVVHVEEIPAGSSGGGFDNEEMVLQKALKYKELFGGSNNNNDIMLKVIEMQSQFSQSITNLISKVNEKSLEAQLQMERRFAEMIEKQNVSKSGFPDLIQAVEFINMIKGDPAETSLIDKIIGNPVFQNIASSFVANAQSANAPVPKQIEQISTNGEIPQEFINKLTLENKEKGIENVMKAYKIDRDRAVVIVDGILKSKGLIQ